MVKKMQDKPHEMSHCHRAREQRLASGDGGIAEEPGLIPDMGALVYGNWS